MLMMMAHPYQHRAKCVYILMRNSWHPLVNLRTIVSDTKYSYILRTGRCFYEQFAKYTKNVYCLCKLLATKYVVNFNCVGVMQETTSADHSSSDEFEGVQCKKKSAHNNGKLHAEEETDEKVGKKMNKVGDDKNKKEEDANKKEETKKKRLTKEKMEAETKRLAEQKKEREEEKKRIAEDAKIKADERKKLTEDRRKAAEERKKKAEEEKKAAADDRKKKADAKKRMAVKVKNNKAVETQQRTSGTVKTAAERSRYTSKEFITDTEDTEDDEKDGKQNAEDPMPADKVCKL